MAMITVDTITPAQFTEACQLSCIPVVTTAADGFGDPVSMVGRPDGRTMLYLMRKPGDFAGYTLTIDTGWFALPKAAAFLVNLHIAGVR